MRKVRAGLLRHQTKRNRVHKIETSDAGMKQRTRKYLLIGEAIVCFALPTFFLFWGTLTLPLWILGASNGATYPLVHALCTIGGWFGLVALVLVLRYLLRTGPTRIRWFLVLPLNAAGLLSIWATMTGQFEGFELNGFSFLSIVVPTLCTVHFLWLAMRRCRNESPDKPIQATCEDARA
jgi:hypothetical protein